MLAKRHSEYCHFQSPVTYLFVFLIKGAKKSGIYGLKIIYWKEWDWKKKKTKNSQQWTYKNAFQAFQFHHFWVDITYHPKYIIIRKNNSFPDGHPFFYIKDFKFYMQQQCTAIILLHIFLDLRKLKHECMIARGVCYYYTFGTEKHPEMHGLR